MKERPILMTTESVKAILDGRKTQTRRVIKPQPIKADDGIWDWNRKGKWEGAVNPGLQSLRGGLMNSMVSSCPYGQVGDRLWVRETWRVESFLDGEPLLFGFKDGQTMEENEYSDTNEYEDWYERVCIQSTEDAKKAFEQSLVQQDEGGIYLWDIGKSPCRWRPSIFMPRWASRIDRIIALLRVERLLDISEADARAEGFNSIEEFLIYWDILNKKRGYGVDKNPWNWVVGW